jgi:signal peptidase I
MSRAKKVSKKVRSASFLAFAFAVALIPAILTSQYGFGFSPVLTGSMQPSANPGDLFITRLVPATALQVGDIIAINNQITGTYYSHRISEMRNVNGALRIITKGDANESPDRDPFMVSPVSEVSKAIKILPNIGQPMVYMNTVQGRQSAATFLVISNILALFVILFRKKIFPSTTSERVYKELYTEERRNTEQYRELIDNLQESLAIEREVQEKVGSRK